MCVFVLTLRSMMRGEGAKQRNDCITTGYETPTKDIWLSLFVGRRDENFWPDADGTYVQHMHKLYCDTKKSCKAKGWWM